ncbi:MAG: signal peptidase I, partial [Coxiellaceae bacterium]|nr:signal peptidase I [Coxiellaceae bacterium]
LIDVAFFARKRKKAGAKPTKLVEYSRSFFPALLAVWIIRSFLIQPYRVPTGSLEPTVMPGDFIAVQQYAYGLRVPVIRQKIVAIGEPKRGDVVLFFWPVNEGVRFVKRVVGVPGDHVEYRDKKLTINGVEIKQTPQGDAMSEEPGQAPTFVKKFQEDLLGVKHTIYIRPDRPARAAIDVTIPEGYYFMMGDNRDDSDDSRYWGLVPEKNLIGKAFGVWMSWDSNKHWPRFNRIGKGIQ